MKKNIDIKKYKQQLLVSAKRLSGHLTFMVLLVVLLVYLFMAFRIGQLSSASPTPEQESLTQRAIPKIDKSVINQIQSLESSNAQIHSFFESARNNPFAE